MIKACWIVTAAGKSFAMVGDKCTYDEALAFARGIWPEAQVT